MSGLKSGALAVLAAALITGGCATGYETARTSGAAEPTTLEVANFHWSDMNIYMVVNGTRARLGTVNSMTRATFNVPTFAVAAGGDVYLLADPIGSSQTHLSPRLMLRPGQRAEWRLENAIQLSSLWVR